MTTKIACSPLTGRIFSGRVNAAKNSFTDGKKDVTSDVLESVIRKAEFHGGSFDIVAGSNKWKVTVVKEAL